MNNQNDHDTYIIPPNFVDTGTFFGGMFRARNVIEAGILAAVIGLPVFLFLPLSLTARIIVLCPVSYTHLDVYKRQVKIRLMLT